jgi:ABC-type spermidine/putrescine transport system permease subunit I
VYEPPVILDATSELPRDRDRNGKRPARRGSVSRSAGFSPALPALILLSVFFLFPVARFLGFSVETGNLHWYADALGKDLYLRVLWDTFEIAALVTLLCLLLGYPLGFLIATTTPLWATVGFIFVLLPLWTSVLVRTYAWMVLLGRNGVLNRLLIDGGVITAPLPLLHNFTGVLIGMVHVLLPYMVLLIYGAVRRLDPAIVQAAQGLGASTWRIFWRIYVPLTMNGIFAGCVMVFVLALGFFITPALLGGGRVIMIAVLIEQQVRETLNWPFAAALSAVLLTATLLVYALAQRFAREEPAS